MGSDQGNYAKTLFHLTSIELWFAYNVQESQKWITTLLCIWQRLFELPDVSNPDFSWVNIRRKFGHMPCHMWHIIFISHQHFQFHLEAVLAARKLLQVQCVLPKLSNSAIYSFSGCTWLSAWKWSNSKRYSSSRTQWLLLENICPKSILDKSQF